MDSIKDDHGDVTVKNTNAYFTEYLVSELLLNHAPSLQLLFPCPTHPIKSSSCPVVNNLIYWQTFPSYWFDYWRLFYGSTASALRGGHRSWIDLFGGHPIPPLDSALPHPLLVHRNINKYPAQSLLCFLVLLETWQAHPPSISFSWRRYPSRGRDSRKYQLQA